MAALAALPACGGETGGGRTGDRSDGHLAAAERGRGVFGECSACHETRSSASEDGGARRIGPSLYGVYGRKAASLAGFEYSRSLASLDVVWDAATLDAYIASPQDFARGTSMKYPGLDDPRRRADLIQYLKTLAAEDR